VSTNPGQDHSARSALADEPPKGIRLIGICHHEGASGIRHQREHDACPRGHLRHAVHKVGRQVIHRVPQAVLGGGITSQAEDRHAGNVPPESPTAPTTPGRWRCGRRSRWRCGGLCAESRPGRHPAPQDRSPVRRPIQPDILTAIAVEVAAPRRAARPVDRGR
jgi:hypothetical protein